MDILWPYIKKYWKKLVGQLFFASIWVASQLVIPRLMVDIIDLGIAQNDMGEVVYRGGLMLLATLVNLAAILFSLYFLTQLNAGVSRDLRRDIFARVLDWSKETRNDFSNSTLITRTVNDVKQVSNFIDLSLRKVFTLTITIIGSLIMAFSLDVQLSLIILLILPIMGLLTYGLTSKALPQFAKSREAVDQINLLFRENMSGIRVVKAFNKEDYEEAEFQESTDKAYEANVSSETTMMLLSPLALLMTNLLILVILYFGGYRAEAGTISVGILVAIIEYATIALSNIQSFASIISVLPRAKVSIDRIEEVLKTDEVQDLEAGEGTATSSEKNIIFKDVDFYYPGSQNPALKDISFELDKGDTKAVIGSTGSGKSTLVRLLIRDYGLRSGEITINGQDIQTFDQEELNQVLTVIPQTTFLFSGTVRENIQAGKEDATDEEIWAALDMAQIGDFFRNTEEGLDTLIAQKAVNLSGGQKQRIALARGFIRDTDFYVFDDCFSALDYSTERRIREDISQRLEDKGVLVIAQRVATVSHAEEILVMDEGQIVDRGQHDDLLAHSSVYQEIVESQVKREELA